MKINTGYFDQSKNFKFERKGLPAKSPSLGCIVIKLSDTWQLKTIKLEELECEN